MGFKERGANIATLYQWWKNAKEFISKFNDKDSSSDKNKSLIDFSMEEYDT